jgi:4-methylaminobutanoate oxidase (formaldehyde-forming)
MKNYDHIIIGGGILGLSIAYHLARDSQDSVIVLERNELASAASSRAAGLVLQVTAKPSQTTMAKRTCETIPMLERELGDTVGFHAVGSIRITSSPQRTDELLRMEQDAKDNNIPYQTLNASEAAERAPWLDVNNAHRITFFPTDGYVDPYRLSTSYGLAARKLGVDIKPRCEVQNLLIEANQVIGVQTENGNIFGNSVTDAAGAWASLISARAGYLLPIAPTRSHYWISTPNANYGGDFPIVMLPDARTYMRPEVDGMLIGVQEPQSVTFDARDLPGNINSFSPTKGEEHWDVIAGAMREIEAFFPEIEQAEFASYVSGLSTYTPDGNLVIGAVPGVDNFFTATGCCGHGIALSAGVGTTMSGLLHGDATPVELKPHDPNRFGKINPFSPEFRERCAKARAFKSHFSLAS